MQKIVIIGWYGTETIGDRAILVGILKILSKKYSSFEINLGSLNPFFSQRIVIEDQEFINKVCGREIVVNVFDSTNNRVLKNKVKDSFLTIMGGGPLMDLDCLYMVEYTFKIASKFGSKTIVMGCGIGPLFIDKYKKSVCEIIKRADSVVLRDNSSKNNLLNLYTDLNKKVDIDLNKVKVSLDPAVICCFEYLNKYNYIKNNSIVVNLREPPLEYGIENGNKLDAFFKALLVSLSKKYNGKDIHLLPMHYFRVGGDDRDYLYKLTLAEDNDSKIIVQGKPLSLLATLDKFASAEICVGMRFHSVVLQTLINGNNYILDYTQPKKGKIAGFIRDIDINDFFDKRYIQLQELDGSNNFCFNDNNFEYDRHALMDKTLNIYLKEL